MYIYIFKKECNILGSFAKDESFWHSFTFFAKERCVLCILWVLFRSKEKNGKECIVLQGFISCQKLKKRTEKNVVFFKRTEKNGTFRTEKNTVPNPADNTRPPFS